MSEHNQEGAARETAYDVSRPHDSLFRGVFSDQAAAVGLLRGYLPESVGVRLRWSTLSLQNTSFVDPELRDSAADLLYEIRQHSGRRLWLYVLLEHQSEPDRWMRWRLLRYCCRIWERDRRRNRRRLSLRPIVPMVLYHGPRRWSWPREFAELFPAGMQQVVVAAALGAPADRPGGAGAGAGAGRVERPDRAAQHDRGLSRRAADPEGRAAIVGRAVPAGRGRRLWPSGAVHLCDAEGGDP